VKWWWRFWSEGQPTITRDKSLCTNLLTGPLHANLLDSAKHLAGHGAEVRFGGTETWQNVLYQELLHAILDIRVPHDERCKANGHVESTILLRGLGTRTQDVVNNGENWHKSNFGPTLHQLDEEGGRRNERGIKVIAIV
jgi:hypothetical protein